MSKKYVLTASPMGGARVECLEGPSDTIPCPPPSSARMLAAEAIDTAEDVILRAERLRGKVPSFK